MNPAQVWLAIALVLLLVELEVPIPTFFVAGALGVGAAIVAVAALVVPWTWAQVGLWLVASAGLTLWSRRFVPQDSPKLRDAEEAIVTLEIPAGGSGRVQYEGGSWRACCADPNLAIACQRKVLVLERQGTTLVVMPAALDPWAEDERHGVG